MFEHTFKDLGKVLKIEPGCQNDPDCIEQALPIIFLKYLDDLGAYREAAAGPAGKTFMAI